VETIDWVSVIVRAAAFIAALQAAGLTGFAATCRRAGVAAAVPTVNGLLRVSALGAVVLVLSQRGLDAGRLAGEWSGIGDSHLQGMVWSRRPGLSSLVCVAGLVAVMVSAAQPARWRYLGFLGALGVVASFALTGHTTEAQHAGLAQAILALHVGIAAYWIGAVAGLHRLTRQPDPQAVAQAAARFSTTAVWLVPIMLPAGVLLIVCLLPNLTALLTPYGAILLLKALGFSALIVLAATNRLRHVPALAAGAAGAVRRFRRVLVAEYAVLGGVLAITAAMTSLLSWH
jgi:putative copper resistance protein D